MTTRKIAITSILSLILIAAAAYYYFSGKEYVIRLTASEIQSKLEKKLPLKKTYFFVIQLSLDKPRIRLENNSNRVFAGLDAALNITLAENPKPLGGTMDVSGDIIYLQQQGEFFLTDPRIEKLQVQGIPNKYQDKVNSALSKLLDEYFKQHPIYTLKRTKAQEAVARMILKNVIVEDEKLVITLGY